ncbi:MAG: phenylalanine--tRNA ligase subunit alpha, partial [Planctomycetia bacterium]
MTIDAFQAELATFHQAASHALDGVKDAAGLEQARVEFLGARSGRLKAIQKLLAGLDSADRPSGGRHFNE